MIRRLFQVSADKDERIEADYAKGKVFWTGKLVAFRKLEMSGLQFRWETLKQIDATITVERLEDFRQTVKKEREAKLDQMWDSNWRCISCLKFQNMPLQQPRDCCIHAGFQIWTWNACVISFNDLDFLHARLSDQFSWDIILFQEGLKQTDAEHVRCEQHTLLRGKGEGRGAPMISLKPHIARKITKWEATKYWVACLFGLSPPVIVFSLRCPQPQFSLEVYENVLDSLLAAMDRLSANMRTAPLRLGGQT